MKCSICGTKDSVCAYRIQAIDFDGKTETITEINLCVINNCMENLKKEVVKTLEGMKKTEGQ